MPAPPLPPLIVPLLVSVVIVPELRHARAAVAEAAAAAVDRAVVVQRSDQARVHNARAAAAGAVPAIDTPLLVSVLIVPEFDTPAPPAPPAPGRCRRFRR